MCCLTHSYAGVLLSDCAVPHSDISLVNSLVFNLFIVASGAAVASTGAAVGFLTSFFR